MEKLKKLVKKIVNKIDLILLLIFARTMLKNRKIKEVHFSIDDVFDMVKCSGGGYVLQELNELYLNFGLIAHLFVFYEKNGNKLSVVDGSLKNMPNLDFGAHQSEFIDETYYVLDNLKKSKYVRLHEYKATTEQIDKVKEHGVSGLLTADSKSRYSYTLKNEDNEELSIKGTIERNGIKYLRTDIRLEKFVFAQLLKKRNEGTLVVFTHETSYNQIRCKLKFLCRILTELNIKFV